MIKRIIAFIVLFLAYIQPVKADILPYLTTDIKPETVGMYQVPLKIILYSAPDKKSDIIYQANWDYKSFNASEGSAENLFSVLVQEKELAYVQVTDFIDDWVEVIYDKKRNKKGWIPAEDIRFMTWRSFYNMYGRKYGLYYFKNAPDSQKDLHGSTDDASPVIQKVLKPVKIKLTVIKGNWALITAIENKIGKTGFIRWRSDDGEIYVFPAIK